MEQRSEFLLSLLHHVDDAFLVLIPRGKTLSDLLQDGIESVTTTLLLKPVERLHPHLVRLTKSSPLGNHVLHHSMISETFILELVSYDSSDDIRTFCLILLFILAFTLNVRSTEHVIWFWILGIIDHHLVIFGWRSHLAA